MDIKKEKETIMKIMNMRRLIAASLIALAFTACAVDASVNDGTAAETRLSKGFKEKPKEAAGGGSGGPAVPFSKASYTGIQIWEGDAGKVDVGDEYVAFTQTGKGWIGGSFGAWNNTGSYRIGSYDMSSVSRVTFKAKGTSGETLKLDFPGDGTLLIEAKLTADWKEYEGTTSKKFSDSTVTLFSWTGNGSVEAYVKDIAFFDSEGNEVTPTYTPDE